MKKGVLFLVLSLLSCLSILAQSGSGILIGNITDSESGEPLIGVNIVIDGTSHGTISDFDGNYRLEKIDNGICKVRFSYISYMPQVLEDVDLRGDEPVILNVMLSEASQTLQQVVVKSRKVTNTENALLSLQKIAPSIGDGISSQQIKKLGSSNAAQSMKYTTGASVIDGKYVYVRGLGDRYSNTQLNGSNIPSNDPYRNSFQLDLIPAFMIDNIIAQKAYTADLPGTFTGGNVNIKTKAYPDDYYCTLGLSAAYNERSSLNREFLSHEGGKGDWLGFAGSERAMPNQLLDPDVQEQLSGRYDVAARFDSELASLSDEVTKQLNNQMTPMTKQSGLDQSVSLSIGNQLKALKMPLGYNIGLRYGRSFDYYGRAVRRAFDPPAGGESLPLLQDFNAVQSSETPSLGAIADFSLKLNDKNQIAYNIIYNHTAEKSTQYLIGQNLASATATEFTESRALRFIERSFLYNQLKGKHVLSSLNGLKFEWALNTVVLDQDEPDSRFFANKLSIIDGERSDYRLDVNEISRPAHYFRQLEDQKAEAKVDFTYALGGMNSRNKIKFGANYHQKNRSFMEDQVGYDRYDVPSSQGGSLSYNNNPEEYFGMENLGVVTDTSFNDIPFHILGVYSRFDTNESFSYDGSESVSSAYGMLTYNPSPKIEVVAGLRLESTNINISPSRVANWAVRDSSITKAEIKRNYCLPSVNAKYKLRDNSNIRLAFSQTIAKPNMRELAPFLSFDFLGGGYRYLGNPFLDISRVNNFDLRYELFPRPGEVLAISAFYKDFKDPIVRRFSTISNPTEITWQNTDEGSLFGVEFEFRKSLDFLATSLSNFDLSTNFSYIYSRLPIEEEELEVIRLNDSEAKASRPFQGQSPYLFNFLLGYKQEELGLNANVNLNVFGPRLEVVGATGLPDVYEQSYPILNFNISKRLNQKISLSFAANNLLDQEAKRTQTYRGQEFVVSTDRDGRSYQVSAKVNLR